VLWNELEQLHAQLSIDPPTATYTREALAEDVMLARRAGASATNASHHLNVAAAFQRAAHQAGAELKAEVERRTLDAQQNAVHRP
jgi:hypothetical protein